MTPRSTMATVRELLKKTRGPVNYKDLTSRKRPHEQLWGEAPPPPQAVYTPPASTAAAAPVPMEQDNDPEDHDPETIYTPAPAQRNSEETDERQRHGKQTRSSASATKRRAPPTTFHPPAPSTVSTFSPPVPAPNATDADLNSSSSAAAAFSNQRPREDIADALFRSENHARKLDGLPPLKQRRYEWDVRLPDDMNDEALFADGDEVFLHDHAEGEEEEFCFVKRSANVIVQAKLTAQEKDAFDKAN